MAPTGVYCRGIYRESMKKIVSATTRPRALMVIGIINFKKLFFLTFIVDTMISYRTKICLAPGTLGASVL